MPKRIAKNLKRGGFTFHGSYKSKILAARKEREIPGSFILPRNGRYYVLKEKKKANPRTKVRTRKRTRRMYIGVERECRPSRIRNPKGLVKIYDKVTRIEATKGRDSAFPGQRFFHNFKRPYPSMYGTPDGKLIIK